MNNFLHGLNMFLNYNIVSKGLRYYQSITLKNWFNLIDFIQGSFTDRFNLDSSIFSLLCAIHANCDFFQLRCENEKKESR